MDTETPSKAKHKRFRPRSRRALKARMSAKNRKERRKRRRDYQTEQLREAIGLPVDQGWRESEALKGLIQMQEGSLPREKKRSRRKSGKKRSRNAWIETVNRHRPSLTPFMYKGRKYHFVMRNGKNGSVLHVPKRVD
jgi:hypothetical protein